jgi:hypothetical protein
MAVRVCWVLDNFSRSKRRGQRIPTYCNRSQFLLITTGTRAYVIRPGVHLPLIQTEEFIQHIGQMLYFCFG